MTTLERMTFKTNRALDYFSEGDLVAQTGCDSDHWPEMCVKELVDNALDAAESAGTPPAIEVSIDDAAIRVSDNGPGIPLATIDGALDFSVRASDKAKYVSPTRGQQGNALKTLFAVPYVLDGSEGRVRVATGGTAYEITVQTDAIRQEPFVSRTGGEAAFVKNGTFFEIVWPVSAWLQLEGDDRDFLRLGRAYATFNPHLHLTVSTPQGDEEFRPTQLEWKKWLPTHPTCPHWYDLSDLHDLIAANLAHGRDCTIREFASEFSGLAGSAKLKQVLTELGLNRERLSSLQESESALNREAVGRLLLAMQTASRPVKPFQLGVIGDEHFRRRFQDFQADDETFKYKCFKGVSDGQPFVIEAAFACVDDVAPRQLLAGVNWSPALEGCPFQRVGDQWDFDSYLQEQRCGWSEPMVLAIHVATPKVRWRDRGKSVVDFDGDLGEKMIAAVELVTRAWAKQRKQEERQARSRARRRDALRKSAQVSVKAAAYQLMSQAYRHAAGTVGIAEARQVMYAARQQILEITGKDKLNDAYFTQVLLPNYIDEHPEETADWDVVYGARGHFHEPHTGRSVALGTRAVRDYVAKFKTPEHEIRLPEFALARRIKTCGPAERISAALFFEKEGFFPALEAVQLAERYDLGLMSSKGVSNTSTRKLVDELAGYARRMGIRLPLLVVHDFDAQGFTILGTFTRNMRRYAYEHDLEVIDFGLRLEDVDAMGLLSEPAATKQTRVKLIENGATEREADFIKSGWRVELNAMTNDQLIAWLEVKLDEAEIQKVIPDAQRLESAARQLAAEGRFQEAIEQVRREILQPKQTHELPGDLHDKVCGMLRDQPQLSWDAALAKVLSS